MYDFWKEKKRFISLLQLITLSLKWKGVRVSNIFYQKVSELKHQGCMFHICIYMMDTKRDSMTLTKYIIMYQSFTDIQIF